MGANLPKYRAVVEMFRAARAGDKTAQAQLADVLDEYGFDTAARRVRRGDLGISGAIQDAITRLGQQSGELPGRKSLAHDLNTKAFDAALRDFRHKGVLSLVTGLLAHRPAGDAEKQQLLNQLEQTRQRLYDSGMKYVKEHNDLLKRNQNIPRRDELLRLVNETGRAIKDAEKEIEKLSRRKLASSLADRFWNM